MKCCRWKYVVAGTIVGVTFCGFVLYHFSTEIDPVQYENHTKVKAGMTRAEVEELLGCPPGDYTTRPIEHLDCTIFDANGKIIMRRWKTMYEHPGGKRFDGSYPEWRGNHGWIGVEFQSNGTVRACAFIEGRPVRSKLASMVYGLFRMD